MRTETYRNFSTHQQHQQGPPRSRRRAFTLVELLVVIGIIAVLVAILLPALNAARQQAQLTKCAALLREISQASIMYANDNKGWLPQLRSGRGDGTYAFNNHGIFQTNDWDNSGPVGANIGRLVAYKYLGNSPMHATGGAAPDAPYYACPNAAADYDALVDKGRYNYYYNFHMKADVTKAPVANGLFRLWPKITGYGKEPKGDIKTYHLATGAIGVGRFPGIARAIVTDPVYAHQAGGRAYATHNLRNRLAFNLGYSDGSVLTAFISPKTTLPNSNGYKETISIIQYLEEFLAGVAAPGDYSYTNGSYSNIPYYP